MINLDSNASGSATQFYGLTHISKQGVGDVRLLDVMSKDGKKVLATSTLE